MKLNGPGLSTSFPICLLTVIGFAVSNFGELSSEKPQSLKLHCLEMFEVRNQHRVTMLQDGSRLAVENK